MKRINVLVVDDSVTIRAMMVRVLQDDSEIVATAARGAAEAETLLRSQPFDVITLDVEMPGMNGVEFLARLTPTYDIPVIMLSTSIPEGSALRTQLLMAGAVACFDKADAVRSAPALLRLIKHAAARRVRLQQSDRAAIATQCQPPVAEAAPA